MYHLIKVVLQGKCRVARADRPPHRKDVKLGKTAEQIYSSPVEKSAGLFICRRFLFLHSIKNSPSRRWLAGCLNICTKYYNSTFRGAFFMSKAMKTDFYPIFDRIIGHEGGYVNDPRDAGGETNWGITKRTARANDYRNDMKAMTREDACEIYYHAFWLRYKCAEMPRALAFQFFDACVNHGHGNAARMLQRAVDVADDGIIGRITLGAIAQHDDSELVMLFNAQRLAFYTRLKAFKYYGKGWINRVAGNLEYGAEDVA